VLDHPIKSGDDTESVGAKGLDTANKSRYDGGRGNEGGVSVKPKLFILIG